MLVVIRRGDIRLVREYWPTPCLSILQLPAPLRQAAYATTRTNEALLLPCDDHSLLAVVAAFTEPDRGRIIAPLETSKAFYHGHRYSLLRRDIKLPGLTCPAGILLLRHGPDFEACQKCAILYLELWQIQPSDPSQKEKTKFIHQRLLDKQAKIYPTGCCVCVSHVCGVSIHASRHAGADRYGLLYASQESSRSVRQPHLKFHHVGDRRCARRPACD